jgi:hypothetical protein
MEYLALVAPALEALDAEEGSPGESSAQADAWLLEEGPLLFYGTARVPPEYGPPGSARARVYGLVNRYLGAVKHVGQTRTCMGGDCARARPPALVIAPCACAAAALPLPPPGPPRRPCKCHSQRGWVRG